jgi:hypothetical protein
MNESKTYVYIEWTFEVTIRTYLYITCVMYTYVRFATWNVHSMYIVWGVGTSAENKCTYYMYIRNVHNKCACTMYTIYVQNVHIKKNVHIKCTQKMYIKWERDETIRPEKRREENIRAEMIREDKRSEENIREEKRRVERRRE